MARPLKLFLCYRRSDTSGYAGHLYEDLTAALGSKSVFMDIDTIAAGSDFVEAIDRALDVCEVMLVLIGRGWLEATDDRGRRRLEDPNDFVRFEVERALMRGLRVVPLLVGGAELPDVADLPPSMQGLLRRHAIDISDRRWVFDVRDLITTLRQRSSDAANGLGKEHSLYAANRRTLPRARILALAAAVVGVVGIALVVVLLRAREPGAAAPTPTASFSDSVASSLLLKASDIPSSAQFPSQTLTDGTGYATYQVFDSESCSSANVPILGMDADASVSFANQPPEPAAAMLHPSYEVGIVVAHFNGSNAQSFINQVRLAASGCYVKVGQTPPVNGIDEATRWTLDESCAQCTPPTPGGRETVWMRRGSVVAVVYVQWSESPVDPSFTNTLVEAEARKLVSGVSD